MIGRRGNVAGARVNGQSVGTAARRGRNRIKARVANLRVNRLIGDAQPGVVKVTSTSLPTYRADAPPRPSGSIGPVTISTAP